jgi:hypothetical protein
MTSMGVALLLRVSFLYQEVLPFTLGTTLVTVNLRDRPLSQSRSSSFFFPFAWLYVGLANYLFARRLSKKIKHARIKERDIEKMITGEAS